MITVERTWRSRLRALIPFGLGRQKPHHFRDMFRVAWENRDNAGYAWKVLSRGVCDGCALGVSGFHDETMSGVHLCTTRLNLLRLNTMPALDPARLTTPEGCAELSRLDNRQLRELGRLAHPMARRRGESAFTRISWDEALGRIAGRVRASTPERLAFFLTSRALTNEVYYVAQKATRLLGTNNIDNAARLCHSPSTGAMKTTLGVAASTCSYSDWYGTDLIVFFGANPANDQPVSTKYLHQAKKHGTKIAVVNPYREPGMERYWVPSTASSAVFGTGLMDYWIPVSQGGDIALAYGAIKIIFERGWEDRDFLARHTEGVTLLKEAADRLGWPEIEAQSGLARAQIEAFAELLHRARNAIFVWSMGITQHVYGGDAVQMILNLGLLRGYIGREKTGLVPIRGHSGVQGGAEMGAYATALPGGRAVNAENARWLEGLYGFPIPEKPGLTAAEMVEASARGELDLLYQVGGNFLRTLPDPGYVASALERVPLRVHQDIVLTDQMLLPGEEVILLPAQTRYEQSGGGTETTTERRVLFSPEIPRQVGEARTEWKIFRDLVAAVDPALVAKLGCESGQAIREEIARVVPAYRGIERLRRKGDSFQVGGARTCEHGQFPTPDGKAHLRAVPLPRLRKEPGLFEVSTRRGKQFNTLIYAEIDPLTGADRDAVLMCPDDAAKLHLSSGDRIRLRGENGEFEGRVFLAAIAPGNLQIHWPEGNRLLTRGALDPTGGGPDYKAQARVERLA
jgi:molybdopterin-dependent oxidoreductase alpha subunit